jgi:lysyl endopeptidase
MSIRFTLFALLAPWFLRAQISEGGFPPSLIPENQAFFLRQPPSVVVLPALDVAQARLEDARTPGQNRFAAPLPADVSPEKDGRWVELPNGERVWQCTLISSGALGLLLLFDRFRLPPGARFFAYTPDRRKIYGAYTAQSCIPSGEFTIGVAPKDTVVLEYALPAHQKDAGQVHLNRVDYVYDGDALRANPAGSADFGQSKDCNVNVNCAEGANWQTQKKGVARILMVFSNGSGWCSGSLVANTAGSLEPYFLTAHHCQLIGLSPNFNQWRFDFDYEGTGCANPAAEPIPKSVLGCQRLAFRAATDFMLLKINPIPANYGVYFNGWDSNVAPVPSPGTFIHHPVGDIKKISVDNGPMAIYQTTINWGGIFGSSQPATHWRVTPDIGIYEPGSSGSPLFDVNKRIVGQLHGGVADDINPCQIISSFFGMFSLSWDAGTGAGERLQDWLDPNKTGNQVQNGYAQPPVTDYAISGNIKNHWGKPMANVKVELSGSATASALTDAQGNYTFPKVPAGGNFSVKPVSNINYIDGVSAYDLVLISKHILSLEAFNSPWKIIAADANASQTVTAADVVELRKLILGIYAQLPKSPAWRFFPANTAFADPANPFGAGPLPESITINNLQTDATTASFTAVKVGDTDNTASGN